MKTKSAQLYAKVEFVCENNKIVGYVISAIHIVISGAALFAGMVMMSTIFGVHASAILFVDGINSITKEASHLRYSEQSDYPLPNDS